ncbi:MAG: O-antigen ligase family protein, partial [Firmicutes bacterium]|nr:O-antigen ligase family protein [Bacillota bacterium]
KLRSAAAEKPCSADPQGSHLAAPKANSTEGKRRRSSRRPSISRAGAKKLLRNVVLLLAIALLAVWLVPFDGAIGELHAILHGDVQDSFGSGRIGIWKQCIAAIGQRPFLGCGPECLSQLQFTPFVRETASGTVTRIIDAAHNEYLNIAVCQGIPALLALLAAAAALFVQTIRKGFPKGAVICLCGLLFYLLQAPFGIATCYTTPLAFLAAGCALALTRADTSGE